MLRPRVAGARLALPTAVWLVSCLALSGCAPELPDFTEVKLPHERITPVEWTSFVRIIDQLPERRVPSFPQVFLPPPHWESNRSLPVRELYQEELRRREECWDTARLAHLFNRHKALVRELRREKLTTEQFCGLLLTICAAVSRTTIPEDVDLTELSERARPILDELSRDHATYATLPPETQFAVQHKAMWICRKVIADKLRQVPPENLALVGTHRDWLQRVLPEEFLANPLRELRDLLEEQGLPFEELPESGFDEDLRAAQPGGTMRR